ncbi:CRISPR-associated endoribonuclease Cas6 [Leptolyngbya sp. FACHB-261]|uniref:CRISPR-associated endoribonuclease Cas6 n=1 Tax=Leptolyngbya sp. FACHB-261 TaxID=2692806 RepID=UPI0016864763|nr:CRISPR-associated endoribonuclease Cas6 [Leptolyngbya sp. FACHB-261]MBD2102388.1 CRISPR-associated endoribonuclease Cas6 [Leptolyngbya sp. FACHB-261]
MPHSLVLNLVPQSPIPSQFLEGRHLHALFLTLVSSVDQTLGNSLHAQKAEKAFTLSPLQANPLQASPRTPNPRRLQWDHRSTIAPGTGCWWRISLLDDPLFGHLSRLWLNLNPHKPWHLGPADLQITSVLGTPQSTQPWANYAPYTQLYEQASDQERNISLHFHTPTTFRQREHDSALPSAEAVFNSLAMRWRKYSNIELSENLAACIFPSYFDIHTEIVQDNRSKFIGCVGKVSYKILGDVDPTIIKQINALADFAIYAGIGRKTPMGMGMVRRWPNS